MLHGYICTLNLEMEHLRGNTKSSILRNEEFILYLFPPRFFFFIFLSCRSFFLFSNSRPVTFSPALVSSTPLFLLLSTLFSRLPKFHPPFPIRSNPDQSSPPKPSIPPRAFLPFPFSLPIFAGNRIKFSSSYCSTSLFRVVLYAFRAPMPATLLPIDGRGVGALFSDDEEINSSSTLFRRGPSSERVKGR